MRRACIDIGSNTTRLLVADCDGGDLVACRQESAFTLIGRALDARGTIPAAKLAEVVTAVVGQYGIARALGAAEVRCVATAALRRAANGETLARLIRAACPGLEVEVLSGAEEARLAFLGASWAAGLAGASGVAVVDAGGGSCELVVGDPPDRVRWWVSVPVGSGVVTERWLTSDPPTVEQLAEATRQTRGLFADVQPPSDVRRLLAVGGSATSLRRLAGPVVDPVTIDRLLARAQAAPAAVLARELGIDVQRARLLAGGLLVLRAVGERFDAPLEIGGGGLREGLLLDQR